MRCQPTVHWAIHWTIGLALLTSVLACGAKNMVVDLDLFHEMALYRQYSDEGVMPTKDAFAYTPTNHPVVHHEWATGAVLYWVSVGLGLGAGGIVALKYLLSFAVSLGCYVFAKRKGASIFLFAVLTPLALSLGGLMGFTNVRAQLFTLVFLVCLFFLIEIDRCGKKWWIWLWCPLVVVWGNMHGGVVSGIGVLAVYGFSKLIDAYRETGSVKETLLHVKHLLAVGVGSVLLLNVNPYGFEYIPYLIRAVTMDRPMISEWNPIWVGSSSSLLIMLLSIGFAVVAIFSHPKKPTFEIIVLALTAYLAIKNIRHGSLYAVTWICLVPPMLERSRAGFTLREIWNAHSNKIAVAASCCVVVCVSYSFHQKFWQLRVPTEITGHDPGAPIYPVGAVEYLSEQEFKGNLMVPFSSGAFVSWKLYPTVKVSIDSRYEVAYPPGAVEESVDFYQAKGDWMETLNKYDTDAILVATYHPVYNELEIAADSDSNFEWKLVYQDNGFGLFFRNAAIDQVTDRRGARRQSVDLFR